MGGRRVKLGKVSRLGRCATQEGEHRWPWARSELEQQHTGEFAHTGTELGGWAREEDGAQGIHGARSRDDTLGIEQRPSWREPRHAMASRARTGSSMAGERTWRPWQGEQQTTARELDVARELEGEDPGAHQGEGRRELEQTGRNVGHGRSSTSRGASKALRPGEQGERTAALRAERSAPGRVQQGEKRREKSRGARRERAGGAAAGKKTT
jgi:hypothetical protein